MHVHTCGCDGEECRQLELVLFGSFRAFLSPQLALESIQKPEQVRAAEVWGGSFAVHVNSRSRLPAGPSMQGPA